MADPSEPNYVAMLGGSAFGISSDDPYFFPGHTVEAPNLMSQLDEAGLTWKGYFQGMPYAGYRGYCFPVPSASSGERIGLPAPGALNREL